jgi:hypothetical protein
VVEGIADTTDTTARKFRYSVQKRVDVLKGSRLLFLGTDIGSGFYLFKFRESNMGFMRFTCEEFTIVEKMDAWVCMDCYDDEVQIDEEIYYPDSTDEHGVECDNENEFSWSRCDCCSSYLGGPRYRVARATGEESQSWRWRLSAPGYLDCTDWCTSDSEIECISDCLGTYGDGFDEEDYRDVANHLPGFDEFLNDYLLGLAFTAMSGEELDTPVFGCPGMDISDCVDVDSDIWRKMTSEQKLETLSDCVGFIVDNWESLNSVGELSRHGSDFHLSRNGHGSGFFDRGYGDVGRKLQEAARVWGSKELVVCANGSFEFLG